MVFSNTRIRPSLPNRETSFWSSPTSFMLSCRMSTALFLWYHCFSSEYAGGKLRWPLLYRYSAADLFFQTKSSGPCISGPPRGIMNSMIRSGLLCSVRTKILQRLICYWKANCFTYFICWHRHRDSAPNTRFRQNLGWPKHFGLFSLIYRNIILNLSP